MSTTPHLANPFSLLYFSNQFYYGSKHILYNALDAIGGGEPTALEVLGLPGTGKTSLLYHLAAPGKLEEYKSRFKGRYQSEPGSLLPILVEFRYWSRDIDPIQYIYNRLIEAGRSYTQAGQALPPAFSNKPINQPAVQILGQTKGDQQSAISKLLDQLDLLKEKQIRPIFLFDDFDEALKSIKQEGRDPLDNKLVTQLRPWRATAAFIICTEYKLVDIDPLTSSLFGLFDPVYMNNLNEDEISTLLTEPLKQAGKPISFPESDITYVAQQAGTFPYLLLLGGKLLWEFRQMYNLLEADNTPLGDDKRKALSEQLFQSEERRFGIYWERLSPEEQWALIDVASQRTPPTSQVLHGLTTKGLLLDLVPPRIFSILFEKYVAEKAKSSLGREVQLAGTQLTLYQYLMRNRERVCSFDEIADLVWGKSRQIEIKQRKHQVHVLASRLNKTLKDQNVRREVVSKRGQGYFLREVSQHSEEPIIPVNEGQ
jgi:DNA-binding winged helix-turn-helix (wHTH) protein